MMKVSVIVPIYNTQRYLPCCLNSLIGQDFNDFEIILVDDGSTDDSLAICLSYAKKTDKVKVYTKPNGGLSSARNFGFSKSSGEYVIFVDSDDSVAFNFISSMYNLAKLHNADLVCCNFYRVSDDYGARLSSVNSQPSLRISRDDFIQIVFSLSASKLLGISIAGFIWNKLIRRDVIGKTVFKITPGAEDEMFLMDLYPKLKTIIYCGRPLYFYTQRASSLSKRSGFVFNHLETRYEIFQNFEGQTKAILYAACYQYFLVLVYKLLITESTTTGDWVKLKNWNSKLCLPVDKGLLLYNGIGLFVLETIHQIFTKHPNLLVNKSICKILRMVNNLLHKK